MFQKLNWEGMRLCRTVGKGGACCRFISYVRRILNAPHSLPTHRHRELNGTLGEWKGASVCLLYSHPALLLHLISYLCSNRLLWRKVDCAKWTVPCASVYKKSAIESEQANHWHPLAKIRHADALSLPLKSAELQSD